MTNAAKRALCAWLATIGLVACGTSQDTNLPECGPNQHLVGALASGKIECRDNEPPGPEMVRFCMDPNDVFKDPESSASTGVPGVITGSLDLVKSPGGFVVPQAGQQVIVANFTAGAEDVWVHPYSHVYTSATRLMANADLYVGGIDDAHRIMNWSPASLHATNTSQCHDMFYVLYPTGSMATNLSFKLPANSTVQVTQTVDTNNFVSGQQIQQMMFFQYSFDGKNPRECGDNRTCLLKGRVLKYN